jgi:hypothetical protein
MELVVVAFCVLMILVLAAFGGGNGSDQGGKLP